MKIPFGIALTPLLLAKLDELARDERRSRSQIAEFLLDAALNLSPVEPGRPYRRNDSAPWEPCDEVGTPACVWPHLCGKDGLCWLQEGARKEYEANGAPA